jgi:hypothetical protein
MNCETTFGISATQLVCMFSETCNVYYVNWHFVCDFSLHSIEHHTLHIFPKEQDIVNFKLKYNEIDDRFYKLNVNTAEWERI